MIARGFGWTAIDATSPEQLSELLRVAFSSGGPHFIRALSDEPTVK